MEENYILTENMTVGYGGIPLIRQIGIHVRPGEIVTLIGPNGAGKSTILRSVIRQLGLLEGAVYLDGTPMQQMGEREIAKRMSILMTERIHPELMTCEDVVSTGRYPYTGRMGILTAEDRKKVREAMELVHAWDLARRDFSEISDGQKQRILLARAVCQEPRAIVLDEPTSFLDIRHKLELLTILKDLVHEKMDSIFVYLYPLHPISSTFITLSLSAMTASIFGSLSRTSSPSIRRMSIFTASSALRLTSTLMDVSLGLQSLAYISSSNPATEISSGMEICLRCR